MEKNGFTTFLQVAGGRRFFPYVIFVLHSIPNASGHCRLFAWKKLSGHFKSPCHVWYAHAKCSAWWNVQVYYLLKHPLSKQVTYNVPFILSGAKVFKTGQVRICTAKSMSNSNFKVFFGGNYTITYKLCCFSRYIDISSRRYVGKINDKTAK